MTNLDNRKAALKAAGFQEQHSTKKVTLFHGRQSATPIYLKNETATLHIAISPFALREAEHIADRMSLEKLEEYHNSNMLEFPARQHTGADEARFGYTVKFHTLEQITNFATQLDDAMRRKLDS